MPESLKKLIEYIAYLPGIGEKTATKLAFFLLKAHASYIRNLSEAIDRVQKDVRECSCCFSMTDTSHPTCSVCRDDSRDGSILCVVEDYLDMVALDRLWIFKWRYHVLGGSVSPLHGRMPSDLHFEELFERLSNSSIKELIIATNPNIEWEATALYIKERSPRKDIAITRLSRGLPNAGYIEYADDITLINAFKGRI